MVWWGLLHQKWNVGKGFLHERLGIVPFPSLKIFEACFALHDSNEWLMLLTIFFFVVPSSHDNENSIDILFFNNFLMAA